MSLFDSVLAHSLPLVPPPIVRRVASRYVAGETLDQALDVVAGLNAQGAAATLDVLGEDVADPEETRAFVEEYQRALSEIGSRGLRSNISVKLSALGLRLDPVLAEENLRAILARASELSNFVRLDMEDSTLTQATLDLFLRVRNDFPAVGVVLQAYLRRTQADAARAIAEGWSVRLCKGIYLEPAAISLRDPDLIRRNFAYLADRMIQAGIPLGIATHDETMVLEALHSIDRHRADPGRYEFQMLLGVTEPMRRRLIAAGHRLRVYVPYGRSWRGYSLRRLKENPAIARHVLRAFLGRGGA